MVQPLLQTVATREEWEGVRRSNISWHGATSGARLSECAARQGGAPRLDASILLQLLIIITGFNTPIDFNILYDIFPSTINTIKVSLGKYMNALTPFFGTILSNLRRKNGSKPRLDHTSYWDPFIKPLKKVTLPSTMDQSPLYQYKAMFSKHCLQLQCMYFVWTGQTRLDAVEDEEDAKLIENILKRGKNGYWAIERTPLDPKCWLQTMEVVTGWILVATVRHAFKARASCGSISRWCYVQLWVCSCTLVTHP